MFIKPNISNPPVPYKVLVMLSDFAPGAFGHDAYQDIARHYKGLEFFEDDNTFVNIFFSTKEPDLKLFKLQIDWAEYVMSRKVIVHNVDAVASEIYDYLYWQSCSKGFEKDLHLAYFKFLIKVFLVTQLEELLADITKLPCYSDYTWLKKDNAPGAEELEIDKVYVVYEDNRSL